MTDYFRVDEKQKPVDVAAILKKSKADVLINYLPVGSEEAVKYYATQALLAGCAFINCIPVFIASNKQWADKFRKARLPIIGDDIKIQVSISFSQAALGDKIEIETIDGSVRLKVPEGTQTGKIFRLRGRGVAHLQGHGRGDLLVEVKAITGKVPEKI